MCTITHCASAAPYVKCFAMGQTEFERIVRELLDLLDQQVAAIAGRNYNDFTRDEVDAYQCRKRRILELRTALDALIPPE